MSKKKNLLLVSDRPEDREFAASLSEHCNLQLAPFRTIAEGLSLIDKEQASVVLLDIPNEAAYRAVEDAIQGAIGLFSDKINPNSFHLLLPNERDVGRLQYLVQSTFAGHLIFRNRQPLSELFPVYRNVVTATLAGNVIDVSTLLLPGADFQAMKVTNTGQKLEVIQAIKDFVLSYKFLAREAALISNVVDELITNAFYVAPVDTFGRLLPRTSNRGVAIDLPANEQVTVRVGIQDDIFCVTVRDSFGSLDKSKLLNSVSSLFPIENRRPKARALIPGLGAAISHLILSGASLVFTVESRSSTEVSLVLKKTKNFKAIREQQRFVSTLMFMQ